MFRPKGDAIFASEDVRRMAEEGMGEREIAQAVGAPLGSVLAATPGLFRCGESVDRSGPGFCESCGHRLHPQNPGVRCVACQPGRHEMVERVRALRATGISSEEVAEELQITVATAHAMWGMAKGYGLHRQRKPMRSRAAR